VKFLFLTQYYPPEIGGPQTRLQSMATELLRCGHEVEVVTGLPNYPRGVFFDGYGKNIYLREIRNGIIVHRVWLYPAMGSGFARILNYATFSLACLFGLFRAAKPNYLIVESPPLTTSIPAWIASRLWNIPFILNVADLWPDAIVEHGFLKPGLMLRTFFALESWSYRKAAYVNAVTDGIRDALLSRKLVPPQKILRLPNGADTRHFYLRDPDMALKEKLGLQGKRIILWAGTLGFAHGLDFVLRAAKLLSGQPDVHFLFVGDGSSRQQLEQLAITLNLANVTFQDPVPIEDLPPYFSIAECGLASLRSLPTHDGAKPSKVFPVLASAMPLIFVGGGECARLVHAARAGIVVPPENPEALASAITRLFSDTEALRTMGLNGRRYVEEHFDWSKLVSSWVSQLTLPATQPFIPNSSVRQVAPNE
jgi:colanic acid biosynthesis glycosyl transferase WcaI